MLTTSTWALTLLLLTSHPTRLTGPGGDDRQPEPSPDGSRVVFETNRGGDWNIYLMNVDGTEARPLTDGPAADRFGTWTPAGDRVLFQSDRGGRPALYLVSVTGGDVLHLGGYGHAEMVPDIAPDGRTIAFTAARNDNLDLYALSLGRPEPGRIDRLTENSYRDLWPRFSPDGSQIVFFSRRDTGGDDDEIYIRRLDDAHGQRVTRRPGHDFCPSFSPDGSAIVAAARNAAGSERFLEILDLDGRERHRLGLGFDRVTHPSWSPRGDRIYYAARTEEGDYDVYVEELPDGVRSSPATSKGCCDLSQRRAWLSHCIFLTPLAPAQDIVFPASSNLSAAVVAACEQRLAVAARSGKNIFRTLEAVICCSRERRAAWLAACEADARRIRPGMALSALNESFRRDGGVVGPGESRWVHQRCLDLKLQVRYQPAPGRLFAEDGKEPITEVVGPYIGPSFGD